MHIAILGAGFTGLTTGYQLSKEGYKVTIFEKESYPGGLASGFKFNHWQWPLERAYHHLFTSDWAARNLLIEIGIKDKLFFKRPITASLYTKKQELRIKNQEKSNKTSSVSIYQLDSPLSLLRFPLLPLSDRLRTGAMLAYLRLTPFWQHFEKTSAKEWLSHFMGKKSWQVLWEPLFISKFGKYADSVNMAWFWARVKKRSNQLGYIKGGFQAFAEKLAEKIIEQSGVIHYNTRVKEILYTREKWQVIVQNQETERKKSLEIRNLKFEIILSTLPTPIFIKTTPQLPKKYIKRLHNIPHLHAMNLILELKEPFLPSLPFLSDEEGIALRKRLQKNSYLELEAFSLALSRSESSGQATKKEKLPSGALSKAMPKSSKLHPYWLNICDPSWPFLALVEHTNFISPKHYGGSHFLYIGNYLPKEHEFFKKTKEELLNVFLPYLKRINPAYNFGLCTLDFELFSGPFAQPVIGINYSQKRPSLSTPLPNLYLANLDCVYPWDRGTNYAIELGKTVSSVICNSLSRRHST